MTTRLAIIGSRDYTNLEDVSTYVQSLPLDTTVISGGARGVDATAETEARQRGLEVLSIRPNYDLLGRRAPLARNDDIVAGCNALTAFWDGVSRGTGYTVRHAKEMHRSPITIYERTRQHPERLTVVTRTWRGRDTWWHVAGWRTAGESICPDCGESFELREDVEAYYPATGEIERMGNTVTGWGMPHGGCEACGTYVHGGFEHDYIIRPRQARG